jgi:translation elongation factor P/translation initiation factor 5A
MGTASELKKGKFFEVGGSIYQVVRKELVAYGTHSHSKLKITAADLFSKKSKEFTFMHEDKVDILDLMKKTASVIAKTPNGVQIMDPVSYETLDADADSEVLDSINDGDEVIFINHEGMVRILEKKS